MSKSVVAVTMLCLLLAAPAYAQMGGGMGGMGGGQSGGLGGGGGHGGRGGHGGKQGGDAGPKKPEKGPPNADKPTNQIEIVGVITAIDPATSRLTIAYEPVDELNWPHGTMPFPVSDDALMKDRKVGEKVRFKIEEHEIYDIAPFDAPRAEAPPPEPAPAPAKLVRRPAPVS